MPTATPETDADLPPVPRAAAALGRDLDAALARGELRVVYQPIVALADGRVLGAEALLRWTHPTRGEVLPSAFVAAAERSGAIVAIGRFVLWTACRDAAAWRHATGDAPFVTVNVSHRQLLDPAFPDDVRDALRDAGLPPAGADGARDVGDEPRVLAALGVLLGLESDPGKEVEHLLDHPLVSVRSRLATLLAEHGPRYAASLRSWLLQGTFFEDARSRALRTVLDAYVRSALEPDVSVGRAVAALLQHGDWGVRADAARLIRRWQALPKADAAVLAEVVGVLDKHLASETDPYVRTQGAKR